MCFNSSRSTVQFPPYTGGCIAYYSPSDDKVVVSSLYGRVYLFRKSVCFHYSRFLPIREGVSGRSVVAIKFTVFPPYTGGCIGQLNLPYYDDSVSSLYGRVYRHCHLCGTGILRFLPIREGVSPPKKAKKKNR